MQRFGKGNALGVARMYMPNLKYAYDVVRNGGYVVAQSPIPDIAGVPVEDMPVCEYPFGATVTGHVRGTDYLGQQIEDDSGQIAFLRVHEAEEGATWNNVFGLPYAFASDDGNQPITVTPPTADGDHRGTFAAEPTDEPIDFRYVPVIGNLYGDAYIPDRANVVVGLSILEPPDGSTQPPVFSFVGEGAEPESEVELWSSDRNPDADPPNATTTSAIDGTFSFDGSTPVELGTLLWRVKNGDTTSPEITVTVVEEGLQHERALRERYVNKDNDSRNPAEIGQRRRDREDAVLDDADDDDGEHDGSPDTDLGDSDFEGRMDNDDTPLDVPQRFNSHADSDAWLLENDLPQPDGWGSMTLTDKVMAVQKLYGTTSDV